MINHMPRIHKAPIAGVAAAALALLLAACQEPTRAVDYKDAYPLAVSPETVSLAIRAPSGDAGLTGQQALNFGRFVTDYHNRGNALTIETGRGKQAVAGAQRMRALLVKAGVRAREIALAHGSSGAAAGDTVTLSFTARKVAVPDCGNFTSKTTPNWTNRRHTNLGCATRRNLGLMVRDPADLEGAKTMTGGDGTRATGVITNYRTAPSVTGAGGEGEGVGE